MSRQRDRRDQPSLDRAALKLAGEGWQVFPLHTVDDEGRCSCGRNACTGNNRGKHPRVLKWQQVATDDEEQIAEWWTRWPDSNIGVLAGDPHEGGSGVWTLDFDADPQQGKDGLAVRAQLEAEHGPLGGLVLQTGRGVQHAFQWTEECPDRPATDIAPGVDIRSNGSYFLAPPSRHYLGRSYRWLDGRPTPAPSWLLAWVRARKPARPAARDTGPTVAPSPPAPPGAPGQNGASGMPTQQPPRPSRQRREPRDRYGIDEIRQMLGYLRGEGRDDWLRVGFALHESDLEEPDAFALWDAWSRNWPQKYDLERNRLDWASFAREYSGERVTLGSMVKHARSAGWRPPREVSIASEDPQPVPFQDAESGPKILIDELFGDAPQFAGYLHQAREYLQVPESTLALAHLVGVSAVVSKRFEFDNGKFVQPANLWLLSLLPTGGRKSEVVDLVREPILAVATGSKAQQLRDNALNEAQAINEEIEATSCAESPDRDRLRKLKFELVELKRDCVDLTDMITTDATEAGLQEALVRSNGVGLICDGEAATLHHAVSPFWVSRGAAPQNTTWLNAYSGKTIKVNRGRRDRLQGIIRKPALSVCLIIQTGSPSSYLFDNQNLRDSGFMARFLVDIPEFRPEDIAVDVPRPPDDYSRPYKQLIEELLLSGMPIIPRRIDFAPDAAAKFLAFRDSHQQEYRPGGDNRLLPEFHNKADGMLTRLAGLIAVVRSYVAGTLQSPFRVELCDVERALGLFPKLVSHVEVAHRVDEDPHELRRCLQVLRAVFRHFPCGGSFSGSELRKKALKMKSAEVHAALRTLVERNWVQVLDETKFRSKDTRVRYQINPRARFEDVPLP